MCWLRIIASWVSGLGLALVVVCSAGSAAVAAATAFTLSNGLQVVVLPDHRLPVVTHVVYYRAGSADDPPGNTGIAHYLEHLMFKGTRRYPTGQYDLIVTRAGGTNNAFTSNDKTYYFEQFLRDGLPKIMDLGADRMAGLDFAPAEAEHELQVVLEERRSYDNDPDSVLWQNAARALYGTGPYAHPVLGEWNETGGLTLPAALAFHDRFYSPRNAIVVIVGDVTPDAVRTDAETTYGQLAAGPPAPARAWAARPPACRQARIEERHDRVSREKLALYFLTPGASQSDMHTTAALTLLARVLDDQGTSPVWTDITAQGNLASGISASYDLKLASGEFTIVLEANAGVEARQLETPLHEALAKLIRTGVSEAALSEAKRHWLAERELSADDQLTMATRYGEQLVIGRSLAEIEGEPQAIAAVTLEDANRIARRYLSSACSVAALLEKGGRGLKAQVGPAHPNGAVH